MKKSHGFTFVEIAIVLVIVGLLLGMVLKGQEIITNAKIKNLEGNFQSIAQAVSIYQERYYALPGDDTGATRFDSSITIPTTSNGKIDDPFDSRIENDESRLVWLHLRHAGLVARTLTEDMQNQPNNVFNGIIGLSSDSDSSENGAQGENIPLFIGFTKIPGNIAVTIESRNDDLEVDTGRIRSDLGNYDGENKTNKVEHQLYFSL
jgi:prepilin-type N-terminal cleavage/methylation domain-containing protein